jgi:hypothetical protein
VRNIAGSESSRLESEPGNVITGRDEVEGKGGEKAMGVGDIFSALRKPAEGDGIMVYKV